MVYDLILKQILLEIGKSVFLDRLVVGESVFLIGFEVILYLVFANVQTVVLGKSLDEHGVLGLSLEVVNILLDVFGFGVHLILILEVGDELDAFVVLRILLKAENGHIVDCFLY